MIIESRFYMRLIDELVKLIAENDLELNHDNLRKKIEEIEAYSDFYNQDTSENEYHEIMRKS